MHWQIAHWRTDVNPELEPVTYTGSNRFTSRGVQLGDHVFVVSLSGGHIYLGGRLIVERIVSRSSAVKLLRDPRLFDAAEWLIGRKQDGTPLNLHRRLSTAIAHDLRFLTPSGEAKPPFFVSSGALDVQTTRGVRELTDATGKLLEQIIAVTDSWPRDRTFTVERDFATKNATAQGKPPITIPEELPSRRYSEGIGQRIVVNRYERDPAARAACIAHHGTACLACGFDFQTTYGDIAAGYIHVHHLVPLSTINKQYKVDPVTDLAPLCPNCHAVAHRREPPLSVIEIRNLRSSP